MTAAPELWLNGRQLTGTRADRAPVLAPVTLTWGAGSGLDQPDPANLNFTVLFLDGMHDVPDLTNGAKIELVHPIPRRTIFAGSIRTMASEPSTKIKGALEVTANATDYMADAEGEYLFTDWPGGPDRRAQLIDAFNTAGWAVDIPTDIRPSAQAKYNSIKLLTMLERHISRYRGRRYDTSYRTTAGDIVRRVTVMKGTARHTPADTLIATVAKEWARTYNVPSIEGVPSPILRLPAANALLDPKWTQDPNNTITGVQLSIMQQSEDGNTELAERNFKAASGIVATYGLRSVEVETDLQNSADWATAAAGWMNDDSPWQMSALTVRDTDDLPSTTATELLDQNTRYKTLVNVIGILGNRPDPGPSVMRSYLIGGEYQWTGKRWEMSLGLERTIYAKPVKKATFASIGMATDPNIATATLDSIGRTLTFADFREIEAPQ